jgi:hypothetical protein
MLISRKTKYRKGFEAYSQTEKQKQKKPFGVLKYRTLNTTNERKKKKQLYHF